MDETSKKAFEITKDVKESNAETLLNVRSGGVVGALRKEIKQLEVERDDLKIAVAGLEIYQAEAMAQIGALQAELDKHRWIPVSERLPKKDIVVFLGWAGDDVVLGLRVDISIHKYTHWQNKNGLPITDTPTHWKLIILPEQKP